MPAENVYTLVVISYTIISSITDTSGDGVLFSIDFFVCLFICLFVHIFVSLLARLRVNGWTDLHEIFREGAE